MFSHKYSKVVFASVLMLALGALAYGGGYWLELANPSASNDPAAEGAIVIVRAIGCGEPTKSTVTATAEGLVKGEPKSVPLEVVALKVPSTYAVKGQLPSEGVWAVSVSGTYQSSKTGSVAAITSKGFDRKTVKSMSYKPARSDVDSVLIAAR